MLSGHLVMAPAVAQKVLKVVQEVLMAPVLDLQVEEKERFVLLEQERVSCFDSAPVVV